MCSVKICPVKICTGIIFLEQVEMCPVGPTVACRVTRNAVRKVTVAHFGQSEFSHVASTEEKLQCVIIATHGRSRSDKFMW